MTKRVKYTAISRNEKLIIIFALLFRRGIEIGFQRLRVLVCNCSTIMTPKKALFDVISLLGDLVIAYRTNFVMIVPKAFRSFHDQGPLHIRVLAMVTEIFRVRGGGRFRATTFCFLTVVFSVASLGVFIFTAVDRRYLLPLFLSIR